MNLLNGVDLPCPLQIQIGHCRRDKISILNFPRTQFLSPSLPLRLSLSLESQSTFCSLVSLSPPSPLCRNPQALSTIVCKWGLRPSIPCSEIKKRMGN